jgi:hypothetical protein
VLRPPILADGQRTLALEPPFELGNRDQLSPAAADNPDFVSDVLVEVVAGHAERCGRFVWRQRQPRDWARPHAGSP